MPRFVLSLARHLAVVMLFAAALPAAAEEPLHARIDALIEARFDGATPAAQTTDAEFIRRVWLDLAGTIPPAAETKAFLADSSPDKRAKLVDRLLSAPTYAQRMADNFHVMLMERLGDDDFWYSYLKNSFAQNKPWDQMVREMLTPSTEDESIHGSAFFVKKRLYSYGANPIDYPGLTRDIGRLFLGADLQCAECHNHLFIEDYKQVEFKGLFAAVQNLKPGKDKFPSVIENTMSAKLEFVSVFDATQRATGPRIPFGKEFEVPPAPEVDPKDKKKKDEAAQGPQFSPMTLIAEGLPSADNRLFVHNIANRLWFVMQGRGLVDPLDLFHSENPPSHPELLQLLGDELVAHDFDIKYLIREIALSKTYQRSSVIPDGADQQEGDQQQEPPADRYLVALEKRLSAEQLLASMLIATGNEKLSEPDAEGKPNEAYTDLKKRFTAAFANEERDPETSFSATVKGSLFLLNDDKILDLLEPQAGNLMERLLAIQDNQQLTDELFLSVFSRNPADEERQIVSEMLSSSKDRQTALRQTVWAMLTSMPFYVNH